MGEGDVAVFGGLGIGLAHALVLLDLHDDHGTSTTDPLVLDYLIAGSMLADLWHGGRVRKHGGEHISLAPGPPLSRMLSPIEDALGGRPVPMERVIRDVRDDQLRHTVHSDLVGRGVLRVKHRRRLFRSRTEWPTADPKLEAALIAHLRSQDIPAPKEEQREDSLFSLMAIGSMLGSVWPDRVPEAIQLRARRSAIGLSVRNAIRNDGRVPLSSPLHND